MRCTKFDCCNINVIVYTLKLVSSARERSEVPRANCCLNCRDPLGPTFERCPEKGESVAQSNFQIPVDVRDLVEKSVEQARTAFETFAGAAHKAVSSIEPVLPSGAKELSGKAFSYSEANIKAAFDLAQKLVHAKDAQEFLQLQADFVKAQAEAIQEQARELSAAVQTAMTTKPRDISS